MQPTALRDDFTHWARYRVKQARAYARRTAGHRPTRPFELLPPSNCNLMAKPAFSEISGVTMRDLAARVTPLPTGAGVSARRRKVASSKCSTIGPILSQGPPTLRSRAGCADGAPCLGGDGGKRQHNYVLT